MGGSKIKLTGEEFEHSLALTISEIKEKVRKKREEVTENGKRLKSSPLLTLIDNGEFTKDFIVKEIPGLQNKCSKLPSGARKVLEATISIAVRRAVAQKSSEVQSEKL